MLEVPVGRFGVSVDLSIAEVANEEIAAEAAEVRRSEGNSPRCVELTMLRDPREQRAGGVVDVYEPPTLSVDLVDRISVLFSVGDEDARSDRLYPERRVAGWQVRVDERSRARHEVEGRVEHIDTTVVEVRRIEPVARRRRGEREALVDRTDRGAVGQDHGLSP